MAINYAEKYSNKVDERFIQASLTQNVFNNEYDWSGVNTVHIYSIVTSPMNDYQISGDNRYGQPDELGDNTQTLILDQDRSFTFTIDRRNYADTMMIKEAGRALRRQIDEVVIPEVDAYRISKLVAGAGNTGTGSISPSNAYESFLDGITTIRDNKAPLSGTFAFISSNFYKNIRLDGSFIQSSDIAQKMLLTGQVGMIENVPLIFVPTGYFPDGVEFLITNKIAAVAPQKLTDYKTHDNPPGINGWLVEGRVYHDCFVLDNKADAIYVHKSA